MKTAIQYDLIARLYTFQSIATLDLFENIFGEHGFHMWQKFVNSFHKNPVSFFAWMHSDNRELLINALSSVEPYGGIKDE